MTASEQFIEELTALCAKHGALMFARRDSVHSYISIEVGGVWLDFKAIDSKGTTK